MVMLITPSHVHMHLDVLSSAGKLLISTVGAPGIHGAAVAGTQGIGVNTPSAAAVAVTTSGLVGAAHMPKVGMFSIGAKSMMVAAGMLLTIVVGALVAMSDAGAAPNVQAIIAPVTTCCGMVPPCRQPSHRNHVPARVLGATENRRRSGRPIAQVAKLR
jgi:hypothetical protein